MRRLFASLDIHNDNIEVQKQNQTEIKKLQTKVLDSTIFGIYYNTFLTKKSSFPKFSVKASYEKT